MILGTTYRPAVPDLTDPGLYADHDPHAVWRALRAYDPVYWQPVGESHADGDPGAGGPHPGAGPGFWAVTRYADVERVLRDDEAFTWEGGSRPGTPGGPDGLDAFVERAARVRPGEAVLDALRADIRALLPSDGGPFDFAAAMRELPLVVLGGLLGPASRGAPREVLAYLSQVPVATVLELAGSGGYAAWATRPDLLDSGVEEALRWATPFRRVVRTTRRSVVLSGDEIPEGQQVLAVLASANRDRRVFADPDTFDAARRPNRHLAFGAGDDQFEGADLVRLALRLLFTELFAAYSALDVVGEPVRRPSVFLAGIESLPVRGRPHRPSHP